MPAKVSGSGPVAGHHNFRRGQWTRHPSPPNLPAVDPFSPHPALAAAAVEHLAAAALLQPKLPPLPLLPLRLLLPPRQAPSLSRPKPRWHSLHRDPLDASG